ncbi:KdelR [Cordylochernes scorpioides]|uniref:ER lumen protein-retaining receptor n=1 Tax=Cordylochernes scorpioides TaxID=51811 RepID=A0ABY6L5Y7_9ARAC|nr:KdelR [Cordylochernes scorpioides]
MGLPGALGHSNPSPVPIKAPSSSLTDPTYSKMSPYQNIPAIWGVHVRNMFDDNVEEFVEKNLVFRRISGRSQVLFALVYTTRYLDLVTNYVSLYNSVMKVVFLGTSYATLYLMWAKFKATYDRNHDTLRIEFLVGPALVLALLLNHDFTPLESAAKASASMLGTASNYRQSQTFTKVCLDHGAMINESCTPTPHSMRSDVDLHAASPVAQVLWTFSIYLESVAILPQLFMVSKTGEAETITSHYLFCLGSYRALYILNWIYRYYFEGFIDPIAVVAGIVQTVLYCDFFYLYVTKVIKGKALKLPA